MAATDAVILSVQADGVLLVVRSGETPKEAFHSHPRLVSSVQVPILGVVINAVDASAPGYYYSYRYYPYPMDRSQEAAEVQMTRRWFRSHCPSRLPPIATMIPACKEALALSDRAGGAGFIFLLFHTLRSGLLDRATVSSCRQSLAGSVENIRHLKSSGNAITS